MKSLNFKKVAGAGLKYSLLINFTSTSLDLFYLHLFHMKSITYECIAGISATFIISGLIHPLHYLRVSEISKEVLGKPIDIKGKDYFKGVLTSIMRRGINNSLLFGMYFCYNFYTQKADYHQMVRQEEMKEQYLQEVENKMSNMNAQKRGDE